jgi:hypothetical protein
MVTFETKTCGRCGGSGHYSYKAMSADLYSEWRDFYAEKVRSWMSLEELRAECGKLVTVDGTSPELLLIHAMHALEEREQRDEDMLRQALATLKAENEMLRELLKDADNEMDWLDEEIGMCDHSVGVCMCSYWSMRRKMKSALAKENSND